MKDKHGFLKFHRVDRAVSSSAIVLYQFQHAGAAESFENLRRTVLLATLGKVQRMAKNFRTLTGSDTRSFLLLPSHTRSRDSELMANIP